MNRSFFERIQGKLQKKKKKSQFCIFFPVLINKNSRLGIHRDLVSFQRSLFTISWKLSNASQLRLKPELLQLSVFYVCLFLPSILYFM